MFGLRMGLVVGGILGGCILTGCGKKPPQMDLRVAADRVRDSWALTRATATSVIMTDPNIPGRSAEWVPLATFALDWCDSPGELVIQDGRLLVLHGEHDVVDGVRSVKLWPDMDSETDQFFKVQLEHTAGQRLRELAAVNRGRMLVIIRDGRAVNVVKIWPDMKFGDEYLLYLPKTESP